jgi:hypothetical protein
LPYAGKNNGIRVANMKLNKKIPSYLLINGENTYVTHQGQTATCRRCNKAVHFGRTCAENRGTKSVNERLILAENDHKDTTTIEQVEHLSETASTEAEEI